MLSILIPVYNCDITKLVTEIHKQLCEQKVSFEIIALDDKSDYHFVITNQAIEKLSFTSLLLSKHNKGRIASRARLSETANYDWLLFLDADVFPKSSKFISNYLRFINSDADIVFGGFAYYKTPPQGDGILRWKYGRKYEEICAAVRNKAPYRIVISANYMIKKACFKLIDSKMNFTGYGLDNFFALFISQFKLNVTHTDNQVYHHGLETNLSYLEKSKECISNLLFQAKRNHIIASNNKLLSTFLILKKIKLNYPLALIFKLTHKSLETNILSKKPSMIVFQSYKLLYIAYADVNK